MSVVESETRSVPSHVVGGWVPVVVPVEKGGLGAQDIRSRDVTEGRGRGLQDWCLCPVSRTSTVHTTETK